MKVLKFVQDLQLTEVEAVSSGCLSQCGNGPNVLVDGRVVFHVATAADAIELLQEAGIDIDASIMSTTALRLAGNELAKAKQYASAVEKYTEVGGPPICCKAT